MLARWYMVGGAQGPMAPAGLVPNMYVYTIPAINVSCVSHASWGGPGILLSRCVVEAQTMPRRQAVLGQQGYLDHTTPQPPTYPTVGLHVWCARVRWCAECIRVGLAGVTRERYGSHMPRGVSCVSLGLLDRVGDILTTLRPSMP